MWYKEINILSNTLILYYIVCTYTCGPGEVVNTTCNGCDLTDICLRDIPCQNGGSCILLSPPNDYTCNSSGTGYIGTNCLVSCLCYYIYFVFEFVTSKLVSEHMLYGNISMKS